MSTQAQKFENFEKKSSLWVSVVRDNYLGFLVSFSLILFQLQEFYLSNTLLNIMQSYYIVENFRVQTIHISQLTQSFKYLNVTVLTHIYSVVQSREVPLFSAVLHSSSFTSSNIGTVFPHIVSSLEQFPQQKFKNSVY